MKVDIGQIAAAGHVVIAGRDAHVSGSTRGDGHENQTVIVGGVEASADEAQALRELLHQIDETIARAGLDASAQDAAQHNAAQLKQQITSPAKPNEHLLVQAAEALLRFGPEVTGAVVAAFTNPLIGKITAYAGERALAFYRKLREAGEAPASEPPQG